MGKSEEKLGVELLMLWAVECDRMKKKMKVKELAFLYMDAGRDRPIASRAQLGW